MFNNRFTKKDSVADVVSSIISEDEDKIKKHDDESEDKALVKKMVKKDCLAKESWDDDEDDDVKRADAELRRMKAKPIEADKKTDADKEIGKLAKKTPKEVDESVNEDKWTDIADGPWKKSKRTPGQAASAAANAAGKGLKGAQHKLDVAKPKGKLTAADFKKLRKEDAEQIDEISGELAVRYKKKAAGGKDVDAEWNDLPRKRQKGIGLANRKLTQSLSNTPGRHAKVPVTWKEDVDLSEKTLTPAESKKKEEIVKSMKKGAKGFKERYGKRAKEVMYATATKQAKKVAEDVELNESHYADMSHAAKELVLHADNDHHLYHSSHVPIMNNLRKKMKKGEYHPEKAKKLWAYHADRAAQSYAKHHGDGTPWHKMFSTSDRKSAASHFEDMHRHELNEAKGPTSTYGLDTNTQEDMSPLSRVKSLAKSAMSRLKNEMLGKAGTTSEEIDTSVRSTDNLKGRVAGGKKDDVGPGSDGKSTKVKFIPGPK